MEGEKERQGDFVFTATTAGEYRFCFDNTVSTFTDKIVDFEISVRLTISDSSIDIILIVFCRSRTSSRPIYRKKQASRQNSSAVLRKRY
jgi:hypothetical protein